MPTGIQSIDVGRSNQNVARVLASLNRFRDLCFGEAEKQLVGLGRFELPTSPLSGVRSNQLS